MNHRVFSIALLWMAGLSAWAWVALPADSQFPVHWNLRGEVDRYGGKLEALGGLPLLTVVIGGLYRLLPRIEPVRGKAIADSKLYRAALAGVAVLFAAIHSAVVLGGAGVQIPVGQMSPMLAGLLFIVLGNYCPKIGRNHFIGIRTPWTLTSDYAWNRTHRVGGFLLVGVGLATLAAAVVSARAAMLALLGGLGVFTLVVFVYSYMQWAGDPARAADTAQDLE